MHRLVSTYVNTVSKVNLANYDTLHTFLGSTVDRGGRQRCSAYVAMETGLYGHTETLKSNITKDIEQNPELYNGTLQQFQ